MKRVIDQRSGDDRVAIALAWALAAVLSAGCGGRGGAQTQPPSEPSEPSEPSGPSEPSEPSGPSEPPSGDGGPLATQGDAAGADHSLTEADAGRQLDLSAGQTLTVTLEANPSTGYSWAVSGIDQSVLRQDGDPVFLQGGAPGLVGAAGRQVFRFSAVAAGTVELGLAYRRPWESGQPPARTFTARVLVR